MKRVLALSSSELNGICGTWVQSRKKMLRCRFRKFGIDVHSYEQNAVNLPGCEGHARFFFSSIDAVARR